MDDDAGDPVGVPALHDRPIRLDRGDRGTGAARRADRRGELRIVGQRCARIEPPLTRRKCPQRRHLRPAHQPGTGHIAVGIALAQPHQDHSLWQVAWDTASNQVAGVAINVIDAAVNAAFNRRIAYVDDLSVRRAYRQRGLGRALLVASLHAFRARGMATAGLGVDAENPSGALGLYERVGFRQKEHSVAYRKALSMAEGTA